MKKIYLSDTNEILLEKIANNCTNGLNKKDIYAWILHMPEKNINLFQAYWDKLY